MLIRAITFFILEKLIQEIDNMVAQKGENLSLQDYSNMKYMDNVTKETLRLYSPAQFFGRRVEKDTVLPSKVFKDILIKLPIKLGNNTEVNYNTVEGSWVCRYTLTHSQYFLNGGYTLPAGCEALIFTGSLHKSEKYYDDSKTFKPERFDNPEKINPYQFIPFSAGSRNCIGQKFAVLEMKVVLFKFFQKYRMLPAIEHTNIDLEFGFVLFSKQGLHIRIARRS